MSARCIAASALALLAAPAFAGPAAPGGPFAWPYPDGEPQPFRMTAAFDIDRASGPIADWTGWGSSESGTYDGSGHAYDNHSGSDIGVPIGTDVYALGTGTVTFVQEGVPNNDHSNSGNYVLMSHTVNADNFTTNYFHLSQSTVIPTVGANVAGGAKIAESNNTGNSTGPHLHFAPLISNGQGLYACPYLNGWLADDEFYYPVSGDRPVLIYTEVETTGALNVRYGPSTGVYPTVFTSVEQGSRFVASQHVDQSGELWYRVFMPSAPARATESRDPSGGVTAAPAYAETGANWVSTPEKSFVMDTPDDANRVTLAGGGSRANTVGGTDTAVFTPIITQDGPHEVFATWPASANAANVTYRIAHTGGTANVVIDQVPGVPPGGTGTKADPYIINTNHYVADHTTVGGEDTWNAYSCAPGTPEEGPEVVYRITLHKPATVTASVAHAGYPSLDVDVQILNSLNPNDCAARNDFTASAALAAGTRYIAIDSYGSGAAGNNRATDYTLTVDITGSEFADSWVSLGTYNFARTIAGGAGSITIDESTVTGGVLPLPGSRLFADAIKVTPADWPRSVWYANQIGATTFSSRINTGTDPVCCVGIATDATSRSDARDLPQLVEVPILSSPDPNSTVLGKAWTGQRFVCTNIFNDYYRVHLTNASDAPFGWISGEHLFVYHPEAATTAIPVGISLLGAE